MAERTIRFFGDPVLRTECQPVTEFGAATRALARDLIDSSLPDGRAAVAAPQIGVALRAFGYDVDGRTGAIFNPEIIETGGLHRDIMEGCLSVPGLQFPTPRYELAAVKGFDADGNPVQLRGDGVFAQMLQHETDHLNGIVYVQTLPSELRKQAMKQIRSSGWFGR